MTLDELTKGNIWSVTESELAHMLVEGKKEEDYAAEVAKQIAAAGK